MSNSLPPWPRPHLQPGGYDAHLFYKVHGDFDGSLQVSRSEHRCGGVPDGLQLSFHEADRHPDVMAFGSTDLFRANLDQLGPETASQALGAPSSAVLRGQVTNPDSLDYLRDAVGLVQALLDRGGVAVFDPFILAWWSAASWRERIFEPAGPVPRHHAVILVSPEDDGTHWFHTRGMLKFGRPDLSIHGVPPELEPGVIDLCNRFIEFQALGGVVPDGQRIRMAGLPQWTCRTRGDLDDPDFNNLHIEVS